MIYEPEGYNPNELTTIVCFYYSHFKTKSPEYSLWARDKNMLCRFIKKTPKYIDNVRDNFDPYFDDNGRVGWWQRDLKDKAIVYDIYRKFINLDIETLTEFKSKIMKYISFSLGDDDCDMNQEGMYKVDNLKYYIDELKMSYNVTNNKMVNLHLFGIKYGTSLKEQNISISNLVELAGIPSNLSVEISKGIKLSDYVKINEVDTIINDYSYPQYEDLFQKWLESVLNRGAKFVNDYSRESSEFISLVIELEKEEIIEKNFLNKWNLLSLEKMKSICILYEGNRRSRRIATEILPLYKKFLRDLIKYGYDSLNFFITDGVIPGDYIFDNESELVTINHSREVIKCGQNLIVYGTPGCGKSFYVENNILKDYNKENNVIRTTFFQDYSNTDFVGQILPVVRGDDVTYEFKPGPFTLALECAINNPDEPVALVIEELNRGNAASIFGDIFQLLDRTDNKESRYGISNVNIQSYLNKQIPEYIFNEIKIPSNLSLYATMNTSDQNVFTLDTAFKRRWEFEKIKNKFDNTHEYKDLYLPGMDITWEKFANTVNDFILNSDNFINSEDKQMGVYFIDKNGLREEKEDLSNEKERKKFAFKVFGYLWDDVAKYAREDWFGDIKSLDELIDNFVEENNNNQKGLKVFKDAKIKFD